ncbi:type II toxin-antitoxin system PemK/MazF family toxin [Sedimentibacter sp.]|uniref:type II toxin-antitoxin system PemK/MazF family toxin n=1 Tax=Sedimentibacter sp. TaxID=1960295 RepID=UPI000EB8BEDE|nr:type II toxin-antitoxin system PemK/MazF family toxin [Sedimentibacter sp.]HCX62047.1 toxin MazF [Clostridiales bacterium]
MVRQGDIIKLDFNPQIGHEQVGYRPAVVISNDFFNSKVNMTIVCPITNTQRPFPLHIPLDDRTKTTGVVLCEHIKALDLNSRTYKIIERVPDDILEEIIATVFSQIEK